MSEASKLDVEKLAQKVTSGDMLALSRALTLVEVGDQDGKDLLRHLESKTGNARIIGFTGPPGAGKSTLVDAIIHELRKSGQPVAVLAVDPVSPLSGGAVLGDRTRMGAHTLDDGVFIRSVSARGHLGGLNATAQNMADVMDAAGWPLILIETVGAGQSETEIAQVADLSVVVSAPGLGDEVQAIKAGILEIGDVLVVNKVDCDGAEQTVKHLENMLALRAEEHRNVPVLGVSAAHGTGIADLTDKLVTMLEKAGGDRFAKRNAHRLAMAVKTLTTRITASIPEDEIAAMGQDDIERAIRKSLSDLSEEFGG